MLALWTLLFAVLYVCQHHLVPFTPMLRIDNIGRIEIPENSLFKFSSSNTFRRSHGQYGVSSEGRTHGERRSYQICTGPHPARGMASHFQQRLAFKLRLIH
jgi:hypothetical protein